MEWLTTVVLFVIFVTTFTFAYLKTSFSYWKLRDVPHNPPIIPYGNIKGVGKTLHLFELTQKYYQQFKGVAPFCGLYLLTRPVALILDIELVKNILIKDFGNFSSRGGYYNEKDDPVTGNLFNYEAEKWRPLRAKLSPTFSSGKMKFMFPTVVEIGKRLEEKIRSLTDEFDELELKEILGRYSTDIIGNCAFGVECNTLNDKDSEFREISRQVFLKPRNQQYVTMFANQSHRLGRLLRVKMVREEVSAFFFKLIRETIDLRERNQIERKDFMDLLIKIKNSDDGLTINEIVGQAYLFFAAGFETSSSAILHTLYELALNPTIQSKLRNEIEESCQRNNNEFTYETMMDMPYLNQVINETLRKYPSVPNLTRRAERDYQVPGTTKTISKGTIVIIPVAAIHHDPEFYPKPEIYDPDRFSPEEVVKRDNVKFLAFGEGQRNCVGLRFGLMQTRIGLVALLRNFEFLPGANMPEKLTFLPRPFVLTAVETIKFTVKSIKK
ncbi:cytochrome P450 6A1-like [Bradysia coprophila]|uniref:cytochrome P450 6A1-like n=1 Tax=Bradysia coprophila TaxID=38358 RepID=UPI00187DD524|nr:cytochrome P450 6A1-like [Bradysia coprophila]